MPNVFAFSNWVTMESLRILVNALEISQFFDTSHAKEYKKPYAVGETVQIKLPQRYLIRDGLGYSAQDLNRRTTPVTMDQVFGIDFEWDSVQKALEMERGEDAIREEYIVPAMKQLANQIDLRCAIWAHNNTPNVVGALGTTPTAISTYLTADQRLFELACPPGEKGMIVTPGMNATIVDALKGLFAARDELTRQYKEGSMGRAVGFDWYRSNNLQSHTAGTWAGAVTVTSDPAQGASSLTITATAGDTFLKGDKINIATCNAVNPVSRISIGSLKQFVVTQDLTAAGGGADVLQISPKIYGPGSQYQNVSTLDLNGQALTLWPGTSSPNGKSGRVGLAIQKQAFALVSSELEVPKAAEIASQKRDPKTGIAIRFVRMFDINDSKMKNRFDVFLGFGNLYNDSCSVAVASLL